MRCVLFTAPWELECCGPELVPGSVLDLTLTAIRVPAMAAALKWPGVSNHDATVWRELPRDDIDRADFVLYGSLHGPDAGPRVPVQVEEIWEVQGEPEPDPDWPPHVRLRPVRQRVLRDRVPARLACNLPEGWGWPSSTTVAVAFRVRLH